MTEPRMYRVSRKLEGRDNWDVRTIRLWDGYREHPRWGSPYYFVRAVLGQLEGEGYVMETNNVVLDQRGEGGVWSGQLPTKRLQFKIEDCDLCGIGVTVTTTERRGEHTPSQVYYDALTVTYADIEAALADVQQQQWRAIPIAEGHWLMDEWGRVINED